MSASKVLSWLVTDSFLSEGESVTLQLLHEGQSVVPSRTEKLCFCGHLFLSCYNLRPTQRTLGVPFPRTDPSFTKTLGKTQAIRLRGLTEKMYTLTACPALCRTERDSMSERLTWTNTTPSSQPRSHIPARTTAAIAIQRWKSTAASKGM